MIAAPQDRRKGIERLAGLTGLFISFLVVAAILTGLDLSPEFASIHEDLSYLGENLERLSINTWIWFINAILIILFGPLILMSFIPHGRSTAYLAAFLISTTGILYLVFALYGYNLIYIVRDYLRVEGAESDMLASLSYSYLITKMNLQLTAYSMAGLSSVILGILIARTGHIPRFIGWIAIVGGLIYSTTGWISTDALLFTIGRLLFIISLILLGSILLLRGLKKQKQVQS
jgi:hypothetical protein